MTEDGVNYIVLEISAMHFPRVSRAQGICNVLGVILSVGLVNSGVEANCTLERKQKERTCDGTAFFLLSPDGCGSRFSTLGILVSNELGMPVVRGYLPT